MNIQKYLLPAVLALLTFWVIEYFIINPFLRPGNGTDTIKSGQSFIAPQSALEAKPLDKDILFTEASSSAVPVLTRIESEKATYIFSNRGACLEQLIFKRHVNDQLITLETIKPSDTFLADTSCFVVGLDTETPLWYTLIDHQQGENSSRILYRADSQYATIEKHFVVDHATFKIDLRLIITPKKDPVQARLFFGAPALGVKGDVVSALYNNQKGGLTKQVRAKVDSNTGWYAPSLFGTDDRYFIHALVRDAEHFVQRAYYNVAGKTDLTAILEGAAITKREEWALSFYCGPKEEAILKEIDPRLTETLDYSGWLAPISRVLIHSLNYLHRFLPNYGWAIVVLTLLINLVLLPLNLMGSKGTKKMNETQKKLNYLKQRYKNDPEAYERERIELLSKQGIPGAAGCLPKLLQFPIFFALRPVISSSIELYKVPFLWMNDLSAADPLYIFPVLIGVSMLFLAPSTGDPKQRFTMVAFALIFGAAAVNFSAGLCLYIFVGMILGVIQNAVQQRLGWA